MGAVVAEAKHNNIEAQCAAKGMRMTEQRRVIARVLSGASDHPDVEELHRRCAEIDSRISISTVYRTVNLFEDAGIIERHDFREGRAESVRQYLIAQFGVKPAHLTAKGFGKEQLLDPLHPEDGVNRRVQVVDITAGHSR